MLMRGSNTVGIGNLTEKIKGFATVNILEGFSDNEALWPFLGGFELHAHVTSFRGKKMKPLVITEQAKFA
ncbi:hypothetical protein D5086_013202 [Populus alba]|uniref:Uncharacterized protein n=1 Tax=Populus alba TaxID=43335 RepID=A0ACC4C4S3_POPAL